MYLQITTRCNMTCEHCCMNCTSQGEDMTIETMRNAFKEVGDESVAIGGGEPTTHPLFWQILGESLGLSEYIWLATNGSVTNIALPLARMAKNGVIGCALSQDYYHDEIDDEVIQAFTKNPKTIYGSKENDLREIRDVSRLVLDHGRAKENSLSENADCCCADLFVKPNGDVMACGCEGSPCFGNVNTAVNVPKHWQVGECYNDQD